MAQFEGPLNRQDQQSRSGSSERPTGGSIMKFDTRSKTALVCALLASAAIIGLAQAVEAPYTGYRVTNTVTLPGKTPRWDHMSVDPENRNLFIGRRAEGLTVVNMDT